MLYKGNKMNFQCYACSEFGHTTRECHAVKDTIEHSQKDKNKIASTASVHTMHVKMNMSTEMNHLKI